MTAGLGDTRRDALLKQEFGNVAATPAATHYISLLTSAPTSAGGGTEATGGSYGRVAKTNNNTTWTSGGTGAVQNGVTVTFPTASGDWSSGADLTHFGIHDASNAGNLVAWGTLAVAKPVKSGDTISFAAGALTLTMT